MREILFRGKSASRDNPEWVEGYYAFDGTHWIERMSEEYPGHTESIPINPETLGQFTGFLDVNGKKIFEGDIVVSTSVNRLSNKPHTVSFENGYIYAVPERKPQVVGNIYDNPELLSGE